MTSSFSLQHGAMLLRYTGISFISGAVNHGFFSGERSLWTAAIGMVLFVLGAVLEHRSTEHSPNQPQSSLLQTLALGSLLSIGLGLFTGGLQHFPDAPARSSWVVPLGFFVSVLALAFSAPRAWQRAATVYVIVLGACVAGGSWSAWQWLERHPEWAANGHGHDKSTAPADKAHDSHDPSHLPSPLVAQVVSRSLALRMDDQMRFTPSQIDVQVGETVRFVVHNAGQTTHEMVLGTEEEIRLHAKAMQKGAGHAPGHSHGSGAAITLAAGQKGELVVSFAQAQKLQMACLIPGHYEAGMRGAVTVSIANAATPKPAHVGHGSHAH
ncbi:cupredoxin family protein [Limnohabitans sp. Rim8]|uniref:cupredoxin family protein n=1 Tax=Limnohabitans sp. Rim8 TaxID=1100718 RepID=UPI00262E9FCE|nr:cupredoxin family protein [Limnohabitans sp. Rim8]